MKREETQRQNMRRTILVAIMALSLIGGVRADEAQVFHLRGECNQLSKALFEKLREEDDFHCIEDSFKGSHYNVKDSRCYFQMRTRQDALVSEYISERRKYNEWCRLTIKTNVECYRTYLYDVQTEEILAGISGGKCPGVNKDKNAWEQHGFIPKSEKKPIFLGFELSLSSEHTQALGFIKSKMEENYRD